MNFFLVIFNIYKIKLVEILILKILNKKEYLDLVKEILWDRKLYRNIFFSYIFSEKIFKIEKKNNFYNIIIIL